MNRRARRDAGQRGPSRHDIRQAIACPDCDATVTITETAPRVYTGTVEHDDGCPWFAAFKRDGGHGIRLMRETETN